MCTHCQGHYRKNVALYMSGLMRRVSGTLHRWIIGHMLISNVYSAGSFAIDDERRPRVISLDFPPLPSDGSRKSKLLEHGTLNRTFPTLALTFVDARCLPRFRDRLSSKPRIHCNIYYKPRFILPTTSGCRA